MLMKITHKELQVACNVCSILSVINTYSSYDKKKSYDILSIDAFLSLLSSV